MRIPASDLLLTTVDNATTSATTGDGDGTAGDTFAQLLQGLPTEHDATTPSATLTVAATSTTVTVTPAVTATDAATDVLLVTPITDTTAVDNLVVASAVETIATTYPLTTTIATPTDAEQSEAASSARMMAALRREFVPTPVLTSAVHKPATRTQAQTAQAEDTDRNTESNTQAQTAATPARTRPTLLNAASSKSRATANTAKTADANVIVAESSEPVITPAEAAPAEGEVLSADDQAQVTAAGKPAEREPIEGVFINESDNTTEQPLLPHAASRDSRTEATAALAAGDLPDATVANNALITTSVPTTSKPVTVKGGNRGAALPQGGNDLPPTSKAGIAADANAMQSAGNLIDARTAAITDLPATTIDNAPARTVTTDASSSSASALTASPTSAGFASAMRLRSDNATLQLPPVFTSTVYMGNAGWSEETVQHIRWMHDDDMQSADIQLHPAELGRLDISIDFKDGQANVNLVAGSAEARELLEKAMPSLREMLAQSGMSLGSSNVAADHQGREARQSRFNSTPFPLAEPTVAELQQGRPAQFRSYGGSNRIDYYV